MDKYIWYLYDMNTGRFGSGKLVYQKRKNGLFYDSETHKPLIPQPPLFKAGKLKEGRKCY